MTDQKQITITNVDQLQSVYKLTEIKLTFDCKKEILNNVVRSIVQLGQLVEKDNKLFGSKKHRAILRTLNVKQEELERELQVLSKQYEENRIKLESEPKQETKQYVPKQLKTRPGTFDLTSVDESKEIESDEQIITDDLGML